MSKEIYVVTMENDEMDTMEIGYASSQQIADRMIEAVSSTDGFESNEYRSYKAPVDYLEINDEPVSFEEDTENDLIIQFAILWGIEIGLACSSPLSSENKKGKEMKQWGSDELNKLFSAWEMEYLKLENSQDTADFFHEKLADLLKND